VDVEGKGVGGEMDLDPDTSLINNFRFLVDLVPSRASNMCLGAKLPGGLFGKARRLQVRPSTAIYKRINSKVRNTTEERGGQFPGQALGL